MTRTGPDHLTVEAFAAVLFDMDGTLVDSDAAVERSWRTAARLGVDPRECLVVEDTATGATAGRTAGATVAGLKGGAGGVADFPLATLTDLIPTP